MVMCETQSLHCGLHRGKARSSRTHRPSTNYAIVIILTKAYKAPVALVAWSAQATLHGTP
jgi:hypothetical protein